MTERQASESEGVVNRWAWWLQGNGPGRFQLASKFGWDAFVNTAAREPLVQLTAPRWQP